MVGLSRHEHVASQIYEKGLGGWRGRCQSDGCVVGTVSFHLVFDPGKAGLQVTDKLLIAP